MRKINYKFLFGAALMLTMGITSAFGYVGGEKKKVDNRAKEMGMLTVKTDEPMTVFVDGVEVGQSGVGTAAEFYVTPGDHEVKVVPAVGPSFTKVYAFEKGRKNCVCLKTVRSTKKMNCPYDIAVSGPETVLEGDLITFAAFNNVQGSTTPLNYRWTVTPDTARVTSGLGTSAITVDTTGMGGQRVMAKLDVMDDVYGKTCFQEKSVPTDVQIKPRGPEKLLCDEFESRTFDDDKARFDNCVIQVQANPDAQLYIILYQGTDKVSVSRNSYEKLSRRTLDYLVKTRGRDPRTITIIKGGTRPRTTYQIWIVPPGATLPVPNE